ncbi:MAG TPA: flagellar basal-body rod protein FlgG [Bacteriovoracaceae bacterium]|nr:flagellar basal-body rod protein FlgG [Bacteriovoracaceae bacterium]
MMRALHTSATGMAAQESNVNTISNNIANVNTTGFKKARTEFDDLLYETVQEAGAKSSGNSEYNVGVQVGSGAKVSATRKVHTQGSPQMTNNPYDLMVNGEGFFGIASPTGELKFTRDGSFNVDSQGNLVSRAGHKVFPGIVVPPNIMKINIAEDGLVEAFTRESVEPIALGKIPVFSFVNPTGLRSDGGNLLSATTGSGQAVQNNAGENGSGIIMQGAIEASNVNVMNEMTDLIKAQRAYEMNSKVMGVADQMLQTVNNIR